MCFSLSESGEIRSKEQNASKNIRGPRLEHIKVTDLKLCLWRAALLKGGGPDCHAPFLPWPGSASVAKTSAPRLSGRPSARR